MNCCTCSTITEQPSPYMQKLANSHVVPMNGLSRRRRPTSAAAAGRPTSAEKPRIDAQFIADPDLWDPATPHENNWKKRPTSAPVYKRLFVHNDDSDDDVMMMMTTTMLLLLVMVMTMMMM